MLVDTYILIIYYYFFLFLYIYMEELQKRIDVFNKELQKLLDEHDFRIASEALIIDGLIKTKVVVVDQTNYAEKKETEEVKK